MLASNSGRIFTHVSLQNVKYRPIAVVGHSLWSTFISKSELFEVLKNTIVISREKS